MMSNSEQGSGPCCAGIRDWERLEMSGRVALGWAGQEAYLLREFLSRRDSPVNLSITGS